MRLTKEQKEKFSEVYNIARELEFYAVSDAVCGFKEKGFDPRAAVNEASDELKGLLDEIRHLETYLDDLVDEFGGSP